MYSVSIKGIDPTGRTIPLKLKQDWNGIVNDSTSRFFNLYVTGHTPFIYISCGSLKTQIEDNMD